MLFIPLSQQDIEHRHPGLENELWSSYTDSTQGTSDNLTLTFVSGTEWTLADTDASFSAEDGLYGVLTGFWGFKVATVDSSTQLTINVLPYPVGSIASTDVTTSLLGSYSIGGFARQIITAAEEICKDFTRKYLMPEAFDWTERNRYQLEPLFCYKTIELITTDLSSQRDDLWQNLSQMYLAKYQAELNDLLISYQPENESTDSDYWVRNDVKVRR